MGIYGKPSISEALEAATSAYASLKSSEGTILKTAFTLFSKVI